MGGAEGADNLDLFVCGQKVDTAGELVRFPFFSPLDDGNVALGWLRSAAASSTSSTTQYAIARLEAGNISPSLPTLDRIAAGLSTESRDSFTMHGMAGEDDALRGDSKVIDTQEAHPDDPCILDADDPFFFSPFGLYAVYNCLDTDGNPYRKYVPVISVG